MGVLWGGEELRAVGEYPFMQERHALDSAWRSFSTILQVIQL